MDLNVNINYAGNCNLYELSLILKKMKVFIINLVYYLLGNNVECILNS